METNEIEVDNAKIGKDVIESLTLGMYEDCRFIYREYIQNAADQVDKAIENGLLKSGEEEIHVFIAPDIKTITIEDNATGIQEDKVKPILRNIAHSTKKRGIDKGFRGIGRLGGLGYCKKLTFVTSYFGEETKSTMTWDAELLKEIINDRDNEAEAKDVLVQVTNVKTEKEEKDKHYFHVIMEDVTLDDLLDIKSVRDYLSMVAPVDIDSKFIYRSQINTYVKKLGLTVDTYNIFINGEQIYKPYSSQIYEECNSGKKKVDDIIDVNFISGRDEHNEIAYWGWYSISQLKGQMKPINLARGIRLRKENIQIGDEEICKKFFSKTEDQRFSFYYFGEVHAISKDLIPNSRRDYFSENRACSDFERQIKKDFLNLKELCYSAQKIRSSANIIAREEELCKEIKTKEKVGYTSQEERDNLKRKYDDLQKKKEQAQHQLDKEKVKLERSGSPLLNVIDKIKPEGRNDENLHRESTNNTTTQQPKIKYRTDNSIYSRFSKQERKLIGKIYASISDTIADERQREALISKIEQDITK